MTVYGLMSTVLFGLVGFLQAQAFAGGCQQAKQGMANVPEALGVHLDRFSVQHFCWAFFVAQDTVGNSRIQ